LWKRTAGSKDGVGQGAHRADRKAAWAMGRADDEDLDRAQRTEVHVESEVPVDIIQLAIEKRRQLRVSDARHMYGPQAWDGNGSGAIDCEIELLIDLARDLEAKFIAGAYEVAGTDGHIVDGSEGGWNALEERGAEDRYGDAGTGLDHLLELGKTIEGARGDLGAFVLPRIPIGAIGLRSIAVSVVALGAVALPLSAVAAAAAGRRAGGAYATTSSTTGSATTGSAGSLSGGDAGRKHDDPQPAGRKRGSKCIADDRKHVLFC